MNMSMNVLSLLFVALLAGCTAQLNKSQNSSGDSGKVDFEISPLMAQLKTQSWQTFSAQNGMPPYNYKLHQGRGTIDASTGAYQAPTTMGTAIVAAADNNDQVSYGTVIIYDIPVLSKSSLSLATGNSYPFSVTGGVLPYRFSLVSGSGSIDASSGRYTAGSSAGSAVIRVTDNVGQSSQASITINSALSISPRANVVSANSQYNFSASGGVAPYTYSVISGSGSISSSGVYSAPMIVGTEIIKVTDSLGNFDIASVNVASNLLLGPLNSLVAQGTSTIFTASGGVPPYTYSANVGSIGAQSGIYTAPSSTGGPYVINVTDATGTVASANVNVTTNLSFSTQNVVLPVQGFFDFALITDGGVGAKTYSIPASQGLFVGSGYTAPLNPGIYTVTVYDSQSPTPNAATATVSVNPALSIAPTQATIAVNNSQGFSVSGGVPPYVYSVDSGSGVINSSGIYTASSADGLAQIKVTDAYGSSVTATVTINPALQISPVTSYIPSAGSLQLSATGGVGSYAYTLVSGAGSLNSQTGLFSAANSAGTSVVRVSDSLGNISESLLTTVAPLKFDPNRISIRYSSSIMLSPTGGLPPYTYTLESGDGRVDASSGQYVAPAVAGQAVIKATDQLGSSQNVTITIYNSLLISPITRTVITGQNLQMSSTGGEPPYTYSLVSGNGSIDPTSGLFTAGSSLGAEVLRVTDSLGNTSDSHITVNSPLAIVPTSFTLAINNSKSFSAQGGVPPYIFAVTSGDGAINGLSGDFKAGATSGAVVVSVTDTDGSVVSANINVVDGLQVSPLSQDIVVQGTVTFAANHGVPPYSYAILSGEGQINASGLYMAANAPGADVIRVTDSLGNFVDSHLSIYPLLSIYPNHSNVAVDGATNFTASGGKTPYVFNISSGGGSISASSGAFTAPSVSGSVTVQVQDSMGQSSSANVTVYDPMSITPSTVTLAAGGSQAYSVSGGVAPYSYAISSGPGSIVGNTFTAPSTGGGTSILRVTDSLGNSADALVSSRDIPPSSLSYNLSAASYTKGTAIASNGPSSSGGQVTSYSVSPALPAGMSLNTSTGVISGTPTALSASANYTITANNSGGSVSVTVSIEIVDVAPSSLAYTLTPAVYTKNIAISDNSPSSSGGPVVSYAVSPALPAGLSLNTSTGVISGTPSAITAAANYVVTATNTGGSTTATVRITVNDVAPLSMSYTYTPTVYTKGSAIANNVPNTTGGTVTSFAISPSLPAGLSFSTSTGVISGNPSVLSAALDYTVTASNSGGQVSSLVNIKIVDVPPSSLSYSSPSAVYIKNVAITANNPTASGGPVLVYSISPSLPAGLSLNTTSGVISGTATASAASASYTVTATNSGGSTTATLTLRVDEPAPAGLSYSTAPAVYTKGLAISANNPSSTGGGISSYSVSPALPAGLSLNTSSGVITGTPTVLAVAASYTVTGTNAQGSTTYALNITVKDVAPSSLSYTQMTPVYPEKTAIAANSPTTSGGDVVSYSVSPSLPAGLSLNTSTGVISGTPTVVTAATNYTVTATNTGGNATAVIQLQVSYLAISSVTYAKKYYTVIPSVAASITPASIGGGTVTSCTANGTLPTGLSLNTSTCVISGTPTGARGAATTFTITASNPAGSASTNIAIAVQGSTNMWTWIDGNNSGTNSSPVYGTKGVTNASNTPGSRFEMTSKFHSATGKLFLFGGQRIGGSGPSYGNDLWVWNGTDWAWVSGASTTGTKGTYGTKGTPAAANVPGARFGASSWVDAAGNYWVFGGYGYDSAGNTGVLNDMWKWNGSQWTWVSGTSTYGSGGSYGTIGEFNSTNMPSARVYSMSWTAQDGTFYMFGGANGEYGSLYGDLWKFNGTQWARVYGTTSLDLQSNYGTKGTATASNSPGGRRDGVTWVDLETGNLMMFGGMGRGTTSTQGYMGDMWRWDGTNWTWVQGANVISGAAVFGTRGTANAANTPGAFERGAAVSDSAGNVWVYGGYGTTAGGGYNSAVWKWDGSNWTWIHGASTTNAAPVYGTLGTPTTSVTPGGRGNCFSFFITSADNIYLYGGRRISSGTELGMHDWFIYKY